MVCKKYPTELDELMRLKQWVCYKAVERNGKVTKPPVDPKTGKGAKANDPDTWGTFDEAVARWQNVGDVDGVGFMFSEKDQFFGIDLDHVVHPDGTLDEAAEEIVRVMNSYTEYSMSGTGLHILCKCGKKNSTKSFGHGRRNGNYEMYSAGRYFVVTGNVYGDPRPIEMRAEQGNNFFRKYLQKKDSRIPQPPQEKKAGAAPSVPAVPAAKRSKDDTVDDELDWNDVITVDADDPSEGYWMSKNLTDDELWQRMFASPKIGYRVKSLYDGDISAYRNYKTGQPDDNSAADQALVNYLRWWTCGDPVRMDRMFRQSGLMRPKWDERRGDQTYGQKTINNAFEW